MRSVGSHQRRIAIRSNYCMTVARDDATAPVRIVHCAGIAGIFSDRTRRYQLGFATIWLSNYSFLYDGAIHEK